MTLVVVCRVYRRNFARRVSVLQLTGFAGELWFVVFLSCSSLLVFTYGHGKWYPGVLRKIENKSSVKVRLRSVRSTTIPYRAVRCSHTLVERFNQMQMHAEGAIPCFGSSRPQGKGYG